MTKIIEGDSKGRKVPSKSDRAFDDILSTTLTQTVQQVEEQKRKIDELQDGLTDTGSASANERIRQIEEMIEGLYSGGGLLGSPYPMSVTPEGVVFGAEDSEPKDGYDVDVRGGLVSSSLETGWAVVKGDYPEVRLTNRKSGHTDLGTKASGEFGIDANGIELDSPSIQPARSYESNLGSPQKKFLTVHAAELWIEQLVAQETRATIGGKVFVGKTTTLTDPMAKFEEDVRGRDDVTYGTMRTKHNGFRKGEIVMLESRGRVEFMRIASSYRTLRDGFSGDNQFEFDGGRYEYDVERDLDRSGANPWFEGDTVISTGSKGTGFIELFAQESMREAADGDNEMLSGPSIAFSIRDEDKESWDGAASRYYNRWSARTAVGRLSGHYDYNPNDYVWGIAAGDPSETWIAADDTDGFRIMNDRTQVGQWATDGSIYVGPYMEGPGAYPFTVDPDGDVTMYGDLRMPDGSGGYQRPSVWQGEWKKDTDYVAGDTVGYKGDTFICREGHTSQAEGGDTPAYGPPQPGTYDTWDFQTQSSSFLYLTTDDGRAIKNSSGSVTVQAKSVTGGASTETYTGSDYELARVGVTSPTATNTWPLGTTFDASDIEGELSLQLQPTGGGEALDSIKLVDITDGLGGGYVQAPNGLTITRYVQSGSFDPANLTLTGVFYPAGQTSNPDKADVTIYPVYDGDALKAYYGSDLDPNGDNNGTVNVSVQNASGDAINATKPNAVAAEEVVVSFTYTDPNSGQKTSASETVYLTTESVPAPFTSYVFQRLSSKPSNPTGGGTYSNPSPPSGWSDAPPSGDDTLWMSKAQYTYEAGGVDANGWSAPVKADARAGTFTIWAPESPSEPDVSNISLPSGRPPNGSWTAESGWEDDPANVNGDAFYMAQSIWDDESGWSAWKKTRVKGEKGADAVNLYILAPNGTAIKNSTGSLEVEAHIVEAGSDSVIDAGGTYSLVLDDSGSRTTLGDGQDEVGSQVTSGDLHYKLTASEIEGGADVYLTDGDNDYDAITLVDVSDGSDAVAGSINPSNGLAYVQTKNASGWEDTADTTLTATFYQSGGSVASGSVTVSLNPSTATLNAADNTGSDITATVTGANTGAVTVKFTHDASNAAVSETVTVTRAGEKGADAVNFYLLAPGGTAIKNSTGSFEVEAHVVEAGTDKLLGDNSGYILETENGDTLGGPIGTQQTADKLHYTLTASEINGATDVFITDGTNDYDAITLVDVSDGSDAVAGSINPSNGLAYVEKKHDNGWYDSSDTTLTATFYQDGAELASHSVDVSLDTANATVSTNYGSHSDITVNTTGENTGALTVEFTHDASKAKVSETVTVTRSGEKGDKGPPGADNQDFAFLGNAASDIDKDKDGLAMTNQYLGYLVKYNQTGATDAERSHEKRWRTYFDNSGNLYLNDDNDDDAFVFESDGSTNNKGRLTIGDPSGEYVRFEEGNIKYTGGLLANSFTVDGTLTINNGALVAGKTKVNTLGIVLEAISGISASYQNNAAIEWSYNDETLLRIWAKRTVAAAGMSTTTFRDAVIDTKDATDLNLKPSGSLMLNAHRIVLKNDVSEPDLDIKNLPTTAPGTNENDKVWRSGGYLRIGPG